MAGRQVTALFSRVSTGSFVRNAAVLSCPNTTTTTTTTTTSSLLVAPSSSFSQRSLMTTSFLIRPISFHGQQKERIGREREVIGLAAGISFLFAFAEEAQAEQKKYKKEDSAQVIEEADRLYKAKKMKEAYSLLENYNKEVNGDVETAWRHSRAAYEYAQTEPEKSKKKQLIYQCNEIAKHALKINENHHQIQKWNGISTSAVTDYEGTTTKIQLSYIIREHFENVIRLAPSDPYGYFLLGKWQFTFSEMPWYTRKIASTFFATPPSSTYEEAFQSFMKAEEAEPDFYLDNKLMIAKCLVSLGEKEEAREWLERVAKTNAEYFNDHDVIKQAREMLRAL